MATALKVGCGIAVFVCPRVQRMEYVEAVTFCDFPHSAKGPAIAR